jgi:hypothetical protein
MGNCCNGRNPRLNTENNQPTDHKPNRSKELRTEGSSAEYDLNINALTVLAKNNKRRKQPHKHAENLYPNESDYISIDLNSDLIDQHESKSDGGDSLEEMNYSIYQASEFTKQQQRTILGFFQNFLHEIPMDSDSESLDGFVYITLKDSKNTGKTYILLISTYAIYCIEPDNFEQLYRRIRLDCILLIGFDKDKTHALLHITNLDLKGDLYFSSEKLSDTITAIEVLHKYIKSYYIPAYTVESPAKLLSNYNNLPSSEIVLHHTKQSLAITEIFFNDRILGENTVFVKPSRRATETRGVEDCIAVLCDNYLYTLDKSYKYLDKIHLSTFETAFLIDKCDRLILQSSEFENVMWFWSSHFLSVLEKAVTKCKRRGIQVQYITMKEANYIMPFLNEPKSATLLKKTVDLEESKLLNSSLRHSDKTQEPKSALLYDSKYKRSNSSFRHSNSLKEPKSALLPRSKYKRSNSSFHRSNNLKEPKSALLPNSKYKWSNSSFRHSDDLKEPKSAKLPDSSFRKSNSSLRHSDDLKEPKSALLPSCHLKDSIKRPNSSTPSSTSKPPLFKPSQNP